MGYDRIYAREEIHQMLCLSERRLRPTAPVAKAHAGHAISQHTEQRDDPFDRRHIRQDSTFASRKDLVLAVEEALHATAGQAELATLNSHGVDSCRIVFQLNATQGRIRADVVLNPMAKVGKKQVPAPGAGAVSSQRAGELGGADHRQAGAARIVGAAPLPDRLPEGRGSLAWTGPRRPTVAREGRPCSVGLVGQELAAHDDLHAIALGIGLACDVH